MKTYDTKSWCGGKDSNLHGIATASPSSWCVCQFRHHRKNQVLPPAAAQIRFAGLRKPAGHFCHCPIVTDCPAISSKINRSLVLTFA